MARNCYSEERIKDLFQEQVWKHVEPIYVHLCQAHRCSQLDILAERLLALYSSHSREF